MFFIYFLGPVDYNNDLAVSFDLTSYCDLCQDRIASANIVNMRKYQEDFLNGNIKMTIKIIIKIKERIMV